MTRKPKEGVRPDGLTHKAHSLRTLNLALAIADDLARTEVESFAWCDDWAADHPPVYRLDRGQSGLGPVAGSSDIERRDIADAQRAARYIELRMPHLPYAMHRDPEDPNRVWFTDNE